VHGHFLHGQPAKTSPLIRLSSVEVKTNQKKPHSTFQFPKAFFHKRQRLATVLAALVRADKC